MERANRKSVNDNLRKYDHLAKKDDFIPLTRGELDAIDYLTKGLDYDND